MSNRSDRIHCRAWPDAGACNAQCLYVVVAWISVKSHSHLLTGSAVASTQSAVAVASPGLQLPVPHHASLAGYTVPAKCAAHRFEKGGILLL